MQPQCRQCTDQTGDGGSSVPSHWTWQQTTAEHRKCMRGTVRLATGYKSCGGLVVASRRLRETIVESLGTDHRRQQKRRTEERRTEEECIFEARQASTRKVRRTCSGLNVCEVSCVVSSRKAMPCWSTLSEEPGDPSVSKKFLSELQSAGTHAQRQEEDTMLKPFAGVLVSETSETSQVWTCDCCMQGEPV